MTPREAARKFAAALIERELDGVLFEKRFCKDSKAEDDFRANAPSTVTESGIGLDLVAEEMGKLARDLRDPLFGTTKCSCGANFPERHRLGCERTKSLTVDFGAAAKMLGFEMRGGERFAGPIGKESPPKSKSKPKCDGCGGPFPAHKHICAECVCKMAPGRLGKVLWWALKRLVQAGAACPECKTLLVVSKPFGEWWP